MKKGKIRTIVLGVFAHDGKILVNRGYDAVKDQHFYRPLGGGIEFGETSRQAMEREIMEELGQAVKNLRFLGLLENIFVYQGEEGHEIVLMFDGEFCNPEVYEMNPVPAMEGDRTFSAVWMPIQNFSDSKEPLYPNGLGDLLRESL